VNIVVEVLCDDRRVQDGVNTDFFRKIIGDFKHDCNGSDIKTAMEKTEVNDKG